MTPRVPNLVIQGLYVYHPQQLLLPDAQLRDAGRRAAEKVYQGGEVEPLCAFVQEHLSTAFKNRDYAQANELIVKTAFLAVSSQKVRAYSTVQPLCRMRLSPYPAYQES